MATTKKFSGAAVVAIKAAISEMPPEAWLSASEAAAYLGRSESMLAKLRKGEKRPTFIKASGQSGAIRYQKADLDDWLAANS